ncbi:right-handed parallel beta-helix repeat-containing protein [Halobacterium litoreum]|uniref:Right-handed parallel beta-helix repeat-containing protein n=1 Tax=Halobacterium litoreum TaxID=2039234 RepID=A0ABD5NB89_9EURY|nr:right-handed parallel beta-helix repeat-containing protein [Halobacterium litoreum]UHH14651.1 right-handed parallel beta-helix repeat-containing protein [Halobacterium litoreum]
MHRRTFLRKASSATAVGWAGAASTVGLAGCSGREPPSIATDDIPTPPADRRPPATPVGGNATEQSVESVAQSWGFDDVVDLDEAGADTGGVRPVDDVLADHATDDTLVYLPPGRYRLTESFALADSRLGIVGHDATIVPAEGFSDTLFGLGWPEPMSDVFVSGVAFDFTAPDTGGRPIYAAADDRVVLRDVVVRGEVDVRQDLLRIDVTSETGTGLVERLALPDGALPGTGVTGCEVGDGNRGDVSFVNCHVEGFPDNGLYADPPAGSVEVHGGYFRNNGVAGVRIETNEDSVVRGAYVLCDEAEGSGENMRGIRLRAGNSLLVEDCVVELLEVTESDGAVTFASELESATVRNCRLRVDADGVNAIRVKSPNRSAPGDTQRGPFRCEQVAVTGSASGGAAIQAANRQGCEFHHVCVTQDGDDRDGVRADNVDGELVNARIAVTGDPLSFRNSTIRRRNVSVSRRPNARGACR